MTNQLAFYEYGRIKIKANNAAFKGAVITLNKFVVQYIYTVKNVRYK